MRGEPGEKMAVILNAKNTTHLCFFLSDFEGRNLTK